MSVTNSMYSALQGTSVLTRSEAAVEPRPVSALSAQLMQMQHHTINFGNAADRIDSLISRLSPVPSEGHALQASAQVSAPSATLHELEWTVGKQAAVSERIHHLLDQLERLVG